jgi:probable F420-dependent oxidoreductase
VTLGRIGVWSSAFAVAPATEARRAVREIDELGYDTLWYPEGLGTRESLTNGAVLLGASERIRVASGIASIWGRDAVSAVNAARVLADAFEDRFLLGLGVSHPRQVDPRGQRYEKPVARMSAYLDAMDDDPYESPDKAEPRPPVPRVIAALRPPMLRLAAEKALGAHTYLVPVEHTRRARELLGPDALLIPEQKVLLEGDGKASSLARARTAIAWYLDTPNYVDNLRWLGFSDADFAGGGSDALVDALVAAGDEEAIRARVQEHLDAGATQVAIQPLEHDDPFGRKTLRRLAPVLLA